MEIIKTNELVVLHSDERTDDEWEDYIRSASVESTIVERGVRWAEFQDACETKQGGSTFSQFAEERFRYNKTTASHWATIGRHANELCSITTHFAPDWTAFYAYTGLTDDQKQRLLEGPDKISQKTIGMLRRADKHASITDNAKPTEVGLGPFSVVYADPPWTFETYSEAGKEISPEQHYPCDSDQEIIDVEPWGHPFTDLIAKDAVLFLWCTSSNFLRAIDVMTGWGFEYVTHLVWDKQRTGTGYWLLNQHEPLIIARRGNIPRPLKMFSSVASYPRGEHSAKPPEIRAMIEEMYPGVGGEHRIEMYARGEVPGWTVWGNQADAG